LLKKQTPIKTRKSLETKNTLQMAIVYKRQNL